MRTSGFYLVTLTVLLSACSIAAVVPDTQDTDTSSSAVTETSSSGTSIASGDLHVIDMTVTDWEFAPNMVHVRKSENVVIRLTGLSGVHSIGIPELGINETVQPGETKDIVIPTDKTGTFSFRCMIPCGPGHNDMTGQIVIE